MNSPTSSSTDKDNFKGWRGIKRAFATPSALTLFCLGLGSGLPFLLVGGMTLSTWLRDVGFELSVIGLISFAGFFYVLKFLWAPLLDKYSLPFLGRRKGWLVVSLSVQFIRFLFLIKTFKRRLLLAIINPFYFFNRVRLLNMNCNAIRVCYGDNIGEIKFTLGIIVF